MEKDSFAILPFTKDYLEEAITVFQKAYQGEPWKENWTREEIKSRFDELLSGIGKKAFILYDNEKKKIAGLAFIRVLTFAGRKKGEIEDLSISPDYQKQGLEKRLLATIKDTFKEEGIHDYSLITLRDDRCFLFYKKNHLHEADVDLLMEEEIQ